MLRNPPGRGDQRTEGDLLAAAEELPYAIDAGQSLAGTLLLRPPVGATKEALDRYAGALSSADSRYKNKVWLRLDFAPGGSRSTPVEIPTERSLGEPREVDHASDWRSSLVLDRRLHVTRIMIAGPGPALGTLQLWRVGDPRPILEATQPIFEAQGVHFELPALPSGQFDWALTVDGRAVIIGNFIQPCTRLLSKATPAKQGEVRSWDCRSQPRKQPGVSPWLRPLGRG